MRLVNVYKLVCCSEEIASRMISEWEKDVHKKICYSICSEIPSEMLNPHKFTISQSKENIIISIYNVPSENSDYLNNPSESLSKLGFLCMYSFIYNFVTPHKSKIAPIFKHPLKIVYISDPRYYYTLTSYGEVLFGSSNCPTFNLTIERKEKTITTWKFTFPDESYSYSVRCHLAQNTLIYHIISILLFSTQYSNRSILKMLNYSFVSELLSFYPDEFSNTPCIITLDQYLKFLNLQDDDYEELYSKWEELVVTTIDYVFMILLFMRIFKHEYKVEILNSEVIHNILESRPEVIKTIVIGMKILDIPEHHILENKLNDILESCKWANTDWSEYEVYKCYAPTKDYEDSQSDIVSLASSAYSVVYQSYAIKKKLNKKETS